MGKRGQNHDGTWSNITHDVLFMIMMQVGVVDFVAFSGVCKSWRSLTLSNKSMFMKSRPPMSIWIRRRGAFRKDYCYLEDSSDARKTEITLPHSAGRTLVGLTCGYLILFGEKTRDFWLVNPITRHGIHFPGFPFRLYGYPELFRGILIFSPSISRWVFVIGQRNCNKIWFSIAGKAAWNEFTSMESIMDFYAFKGKIYTIDAYSEVCELRLNPEPKSTLCKTQNAPRFRNFRSWETISFGENLYVVTDYWPWTSNNVLELDMGEMKWVQPKNTTGYAFIVSVLKHGLHGFAYDIQRHHLRPQYTVYDYFHSESTKKDNLFKMWYYTHDCMSVNIIH